MNAHRKNMVGWGGGDQAANEASKMWGAAKIIVQIIRLCCLYGFFNFMPPPIPPWVLMNNK